jgi:hypothetical protein
MEPGTQVFVNWYGHVCAGTVLDKQKANFSGEIWKDWIAISMQVPSSDGKPIVAGCHNICAYHKKHVYTTTEAAAAAWADYLLSQQAKHQQTDSPATQQPTEAPLTTQTTVEAQPDGEEWLAEYRAFLKAHWNHERNHVQIEYIDEAMQLFRAAAIRHTGYHEATPEPVPVPPVEVPKIEVPPVEVPPVIVPKIEVPEFQPAPAENKRAASRRKKKQEQPARAIQLMFDF